MIALVLPNLDLVRYHVGYADGYEAGIDGAVVPPAAYYGWPKWRRMGWTIGNGDACERRSPFEAGRWARALGLPVGVNPWLRDTPTGLDFEEGWGTGEPLGQRWALAPAVREAAPA